MGGGIAMTFADKGIPVTIVDQSEEALARGQPPTREPTLPPSRRAPSCLLSPFQLEVLLAQAWASFVPTTRPPPRRAG